MNTKHLNFSSLFSPVLRGCQIRLTKFLLLLLVSAFFTANLLAAETNEIKAKIVYQIGELNFEQEGKINPAKDKEYSPDVILSSGKIQKEEIKPTDLGKNQAAISYFSDQLVILNNGSKVGFELKEKVPSYKLDGITQFFIKSQKGKGEKKEELDFLINGLILKSAQAHLLFEKTAKKNGFWVVSDSLTISLKEKVFKVTEAEQEAKELKEKTLSLAAGDQVIIEEKLISVIKQKPVSKELLKFSSMTGFETPGHYKVVGKVNADDKEVLKINRFGKDIFAKGKDLPLFTKDHIFTGKSQNAVLEFISKDKIKLSPSTDFTVESFDHENTPKESLIFSFLGKVRAIISPRNKIGKIKFKTPTATIGIKGTDFLTSATASVSEVSTIEGTVGVADANGMGEVDVGAGMSTKVQKGLPPEQPKPIPDERMKELRSTGVAVKSIKITSPAANALVSKGVFSFTLEPRDAEIITSLDGKETVLTSGYSLAGLKEGTHQINIKGTDDAASISQSVTFTIDKTGALPDKFLDLKKLTLVEGAPTVLKFNEKVSKVTLVYAGQQKDLTLNAAKDGASFSDKDIKYNPKQKDFKLQVVDLADNKSEHTGQLIYKRNTPLLITFNNGLKELKTNQVKEVKITTNQEIETWKVTLNNKAVTFDPLPNSKELVLNQQKFTQLKTGKYKLQVEVEDTMGIKAEAEFLIILDNSPLQLVTEIDPEKIVLFETIPLVLKWNKPVTQAEVFYLGQKFALPVQKGMKEYKLESDLIKFQTSLKNIKLVTKDEFGNVNELNGKIILVKRKIGAPIVNFDPGLDNLLIKDAVSIKVGSTREIKSWQVQLNKKKYTKKELAGIVPEKLSKQIILKSDFFNKLREGKNILIVNVVDVFGNRGKGRLLIVLDKTPPVLLTKNIKQQEIGVEQMGSLRFSWNEHLGKVEGIIAGKKWLPVIHKSGKSFVAKGNLPLLSVSPQKYTLKVYDKAGNFTLLKGDIYMKLSNSFKSLKSNYDRSIVFESLHPLDEEYRIERNEFKFFNSPMGKAGKSIPRKINLKKDTVYKKGVKKYLDEGFINNLKW